LLPIMNPFSTLPLFLTLTNGMSERKKNREAMMACLYSLGLLTGFLFLGAAIIDFFGISVPGIRVAGGLIISLIGFKMLFAVSSSSGEDGKAAQDRDIAFTPLAMPSLAGPGSLSVVLTAAPQIERLNPADSRSAYVGVTVGLVIVVLIAFLVLRAASPLAKLLGPAGIDAMTRIFGFLLVAIGMQFLLTGISDFFGLHRA
jgi:multiple antibiotic resistance protein